MSLGGNREGLQAGGGPSVSPLAQLADGGRCVWTRYSSASMKPGGMATSSRRPCCCCPHQNLAWLKAFSQAISMLLPSVWYPWRACSGPCIPQSPRPARGRRSLVLIWRCYTPSAFQLGLCTPGARPLSQILMDCVLKLSVSSKVPGHFVDTEKLLASSRSSWEVYTHTPLDASRF